MSHKLSSPQSEKVSPVSYSPFPSVPVGLYNSLIESEHPPFNS